VTPYDARPMTIGEILDRAISTYVRRCLPLFVILAITVVPVALIQLAATPGFVHTSDLFAQINRLPPGATAERSGLLAQALASINGGSIFAIFVLGPLLLFPISRNAIFTYVNAAFDGTPVSIATAYRRSIGKWAPQVVTAIGYFAISMAIGFVLVIAGVLTVVLGYFGGGQGNVGGVLALIAAIPFLVAALVVFALLNVAFELSSVSVALEESNPFRAMGNGWRRTFDRTLRRRTFGIALAYFAVEFAGSGALVGLGAFLQSVSHLYLVQSVVSSVAQILITGVLAVFMIVYARDVRLRREGLDLLRAASEPAST
jgi:hypothetical protein